MTAAPDRRLAAILSADVAGYSRLMADDEDATIRTLRAWREQVSALVAEHRGRLADFTGDNFLAEFPTARDAVECALEIQRVLAARNDALPEARRMRFRIGAHLGDVRVEDGRLFGDGVNVAARLQTLAEPGRLCLSAAVAEQVRDKLSLELEDLGEQVLKNLPRAVHVFRVRLDEPSAVIIGSRPAPKRNRRALPRGLRSVAVLPFLNMSDDPNQEYFSEGISEGVLDGLVRNRNLVVRAWQSSFLFKGKRVEPRVIAEQLDVAYLVNGTVRKQGRQVRVTARLTEIESNTDVWSNRYEGELTDVFALQDDITGSIVRALGERFSGAEKRPIDPQAHDAYLLGRYHQLRYRFDAAEERLKTAIERDPTYADAHAALAQLYATQAWVSHPDLEELLGKERQAIAQALAHDPRQPLALGLQAMLHLPTQEGLRVLDGLVREYPSDLNLLFFYSTVLHRSGRLDLELKVLDRMLELDPLSAAFVTSRAHFNLFRGCVEGAEDDIRRAEELGIPLPRIGVLVALLKRDPDAARRELARPSTDWSFAPGLWKSILAGYLAVLEGDAVARAASAAALRPQLAQLPHELRFQAALIEGDLERALDEFEAALRVGEPAAFYECRGSAVLKSLFPAFYRFPRYAQILREFELDDDSLAKLDVPPLPF